MKGQQFIVEGIAAVAEYLRFKPESITELSATPPSRAAVEKLLKGSGCTVPVRELKKASADSPAAPVQARVLLRPLETHEMVERIEGRERDVLLALDHISDPRNLGAIVRTAAFFGVKEVIAPKDRQVLLTQAGVATAQGGFAIADLVVCTNLARQLRELKDKDYWIIGAAMEGEPFSSLANEYKKIVLVLGSEESGLSKNVAELCDRKAAIPGRGGLESLNVSVAAGILLAGFCAP